MLLITAQAIQALGDGDRLTDSVRVHSADGTSHTLQVTIHGTDDPASFRSTPGEVTEDRAVSPSGMLTTSGVVVVTDRDDGENHLVPQTLDGRYGRFEIHADGSWHYSADNDQWDIQDLRAGETLSDRVRVQSVDGSTHQIEVVIHGADEGWNARPISSSVSSNHGNHYGWGNAWSAPPAADEPGGTPVTYADLIPDAPAEAAAEPSAYHSALADDAAAAGANDHDLAVLPVTEVLPALPDEAFAPVAAHQDDLPPTGPMEVPEASHGLEPPFPHHTDG